MNEGNDNFSDRLSPFERSSRPLDTHFTVRAIPIMILDDIRTRLAAARSDLFDRYPLLRLGIFGSVARGEAGPDSDVDILVEFAEPVGFEIADLALELEELLGRNVDLVSRKAIRDRVLPYVERDVLYV